MRTMRLKLALKDILISIRKDKDIAEQGNLQKRHCEDWNQRKLGPPRYIEVPYKKYWESGVRKVADDVDGAVYIADCDVKVDR